MKNKNWIIYTILFAISMPLLFYFRTINQEQNDLILENGIETVGTVIDRFYGSNNTGKQFSVRFDFNVNGKIYTGLASFGNNSYYYDKAIIGMKYLVRYIPDAPNKFKNSMIYIDQPILNEFANIESERERGWKQPPFAQGSNAKCDRVL
ncbi:MAG: hypothetical protein JW783_14025 [Bacteroidales bacterium]|nr:hypothetical protein [Bacteroidales bacterium]MBN2751045.1 hypothetical protein [Bacteroidales bacterium]